MMSTTPIMDKALAVFRDRKFVNCTILGETLWGSSLRSKGRQSYARPAGKLISRMRKLGLIKEAGVMQLGYKPDTRSATLYCLKETPNAPKYR